MRFVNKSKTARTSSRASDRAIVSNNDWTYRTQQRTALQDCKEGLELDHVIRETLSVCLTIVVSVPVAWYGEESYPGSKP